MTTPCSVPCSVLISTVKYRSSKKTHLSPSSNPPHTPWKWLFSLNNLPVADLHVAHSSMRHPTELATGRPGKKWLAVEERIVWWKLSYENKQFSHKNKSGCFLPIITVQCWIRSFLLVIYVYRVSVGACLTGNVDVLDDLCAVARSVKFFGFFGHLNFQWKLVFSHQSVLIHVWDTIVVATIIFQYFIHAGLVGKQHFIQFFNRMSILCLLNYGNQLLFICGGNIII